MVLSGDEVQNEGTKGSKTKKERKKEGPKTGIKGKEKESLN